MTETENAKVENEKKNIERVRWYKRMAKTDDGKEIMVDLARYCNYDKTSVNRQNPNSLQTAYCEGMRCVFLYINEKINRKENEK